MRFVLLLKADQTQTLVFGLLIAIPTLIISGPLLGRLMDRWVPVYAPASLGEDAIDARTHDREMQTASVGGASAGSAGPIADESRTTGTQVRGPGEDDAGLVASQGIGSTAPRLTKRPSFGAALITIVLPVLLMLLKGVGDLTTAANTVPRMIFD